MEIKFLGIIATVLVMSSGLEAKGGLDKWSKPKELRSTEADDWSYQGDTRPETWVEHYPGCGMSLQSPIDLPDADKLIPVQSEPLKLMGYGQVPEKQHLSHEGYTAQLEGTYVKMPTISGGLLDDVYSFSQLHFHWAESEDLGSEHTVDGEASPLEIHLVHKSDAGRLAVLSVLTYIDDENPRGSVLRPLWHCFVTIKHYQDKCALHGNKVKLHDLLPANKSRYFRYVGSTTTPPCVAGVTWTVFEDKVPISRADLALLRTWEGKDGNLLLNNYRPIQDTENREILLVEQ